MPKIKVRPTATRPYTEKRKIPFVRYCPIVTKSTLMSFYPDLIPIMGRWYFVSSSELHKPPSAAGNASERPQSSLVVLCHLRNLLLGTYASGRIDSYQAAISLGDKLPNKYRAGGFPRK